MTLVHVVRLTNDCDGVDVCGFLLRDPPHYDPPAELDAFLNAGPPPIYIGFGSIVVDDSDALVEILLDAVKICGLRAVISKGWSNLERAEHDENIFWIEECPHGKAARPISDLA